MFDSHSVCLFAGTVPWSHMPMIRNLNARKPGSRIREALAGHAAYLVRFRRRGSSVRRLSAVVHFEMGASKSNVAAVKGKWAK
jgi:hypothetical protein